MSASRPIELLDDDDWNDNEEKAVRTFLEFSGSQDRSDADKWLQQTNYNVQNALILAMKGPVDSDDDAAAATARMPLAGERIPAQEPQVTLLDEAANHDEDENDEQLLSITWYNCMATVAISSSGQFVDPDFPPIQSSLDGRKQTSHTEDDVKCVCGLPAAAKSVQSDGPNYGRFYLSCGKGRQRGNRLNQCKFFQWDDRNGSKGAGYATRYSIMAWEFFGSSTKHSLVQNGFSPDDVRQGAVGNCWFLSALAVVAEKRYLVKQLLPHGELNDKGCYQVNLCLDGKWTPVLVDSHLPVVYGGRIVDPLRGGTTSSTDLASTVHPAFCAVPNGQLWAALIEKAYAKAHGSYQHLCGGFIQEGFQDMTGAPTETLVFDGNIWDFENLWARLLSCHEAGFLMGVATTRGGDGLVGGHAYSVLDVIELNDMLVGEQQSMKDFLKGSPIRKKQRTSIRLVRIRNPWGKKEWKGEWSASSDQWTKALRRRLGDKSYAKGDGTFFMAYEDMLQRFHHMDVVKCRKGWTHTSSDGSFLSHAPDPLLSSRHYFRLSVEKKTFAFISIIQPKKRSNTKSHYWYADPSMIILKRTGIGSEWDVEQVVLCGMMRSSTVEVFLEPLKEYLVLPFSFKTEGESSFRLTSYSAKKIGITQRCNKEIGIMAPLCHLHRHLLKDERKLCYSIASSSILVCIHGDRCLYFMAINASADRILSVRLCVKLQKGLSLSHGVSGDVCDVPTRSQKILMVVSSDGTHSSAVGVEFTYATDTLQTSAGRTAQKHCGLSLGSPIEVSMAGDLLASAVALKSPRNKGGDTIETFQWLSQIGSSI